MKVQSKIVPDLQGLLDILVSKLKVEKLDLLSRLRSEIIGRKQVISTPFGNKTMVYADYTASGRALKIVTELMDSILPMYANTHTDDSSTGRYMTTLLHDALKVILQSTKAHVDQYVPLCTGTGATGAIKKLQEILGVYIPSATKINLEQCLGKKFDKIKEDAFNSQNIPIVIVGPYEHHSNEVTWRLGFCHVVALTLTESGDINLEELKSMLHKFSNYPKIIVSISAGSNVTGIKSDVSSITQICKAHGANIFFDFAAIAPYVDIDLSDAKADGIFFAPHKFLGGEGTTGVLILKKDLYNLSLPPTHGGGGTVDYVNQISQDFSHNIIDRENSGTPGALQIIKTALTLKVKDIVGKEVLAKKEHAYSQNIIEYMTNHPGMSLLGQTDPALRIPIISFNIKHRDRIFHPRFITKLLDQLFGIQTRAGCSCAGPYGHHLLKIDNVHSNAYRLFISGQLCPLEQMSPTSSSKFMAIKPGWIRFNLHYSMSEAEIDYIKYAINFMYEYAQRFLPLYNLDLNTGSWSYKGDLKIDSPPIHHDYKTVLDNQKQQALDIAQSLPEVTMQQLDHHEQFGSLAFFYSVLC